MDKDKLKIDFDKWSKIMDEAYREVGEDHAKFMQLRRGIEYYLWNGLERDTKTSTTDTKGWVDNGALTEEKLAKTMETLLNQKSNWVDWNNKLIPPCLQYI